MSAPPIPLGRHDALLQAALVAHGLGTSLSTEQVDALVREITLLKAQEQLTRQTADKLSAALEVFAADGVKLELVAAGGPGVVAPQAWRATLRDGRTVQAGSPWRVIQFAAQR